MLAGVLESFGFGFALALALAVAGEEGAAFGEGVVVFYVGHGCGGEWEVGLFVCGVCCG